MRFDCSKDTPVAVRGGGQREFFSGPYLPFGSGAAPGKSFLWTGGQILPQYGGDVPGVGWPLEAAPVQVKGRAFG